MKISLHITRLSRLLQGWVKDWVIKVSYYKLNGAFSVKSHLTIKEKVKLYELSNDKKEVLEIGSYIGASACCFGAALKELGTGRILCIDTWNNDAMTEGYRDTFQEFTKNTAPYAGYVVPVRGYSTQVVEQIAGQVEKLDLLFIDGDHSYEGVKADWDAYLRFLKPGSVVVFHDWGWAEGVKQVIQDDVKPLVTQFDSLPNMWWGTIKA